MDLHGSRRRSPSLPPSSEPASPVYLPDLRCLAASRHTCLWVPPPGHRLEDFNGLVATPPSLRLAVLLPSITPGSTDIRFTRALESFHKVMEWKADQKQSLHVYHADAQVQSQHGSGMVVLPRCSRGWVLWARGPEPRLQLPPPQAPKRKQGPSADKAGLKRIKR